MPRGGVLDQRIAFEQENVVDDGQGGEESAGWVEIANGQCWAQVETRDGSEGDEEEGRQANTYPIVVHVRNRNDLNEKMRLIWRGRVYNIRSLSPYNRRDGRRRIEADGGVPQ